MPVLKLQSCASFLLLSGIAFWALTQCYPDDNVDLWTCSNLAFALLALQGLLGFWKYGKTCRRDSRLFKPFYVISSVIVGPLILVDLYLFNSFPYQIAYMHLVYPVLCLHPLMEAKKNYNATCIRISKFITVLSMSFISAMSKNFMGLGAAFMLAISMFVISEKTPRSKHWRNLLMSVFIYCALKALTVAEVCWVVRYRVC